MAAFGKHAPTVVGIRGQPRVIQAPAEPAGDLHAQRSVLGRADRGHQRRRLAEAIEVYTARFRLVPVPIRGGSESQLKEDTTTTTTEDQRTDNECGRFREPHGTRMN